MSYTYVRLIKHDEPIRRYEVRVSTFFEFDDNAGRRAVTKLMAPDEALQEAKAYARAAKIENARTRE